MPQPLILASGSASRQKMLRAAGVSFTVIRPVADEELAKARLRAQGASPESMAVALAELKAQQISEENPEAVVLGSDQILTCGSDVFDKARTLESARVTLVRLRGRIHRLISAAVLMQQGINIWSRAEVAEMVMRDFSDTFLDSYLAQEGEAILGSVGCYRIEGIGVQLFSDVRGDHFVVRGMPLLGVLEALRKSGALQT